MNAPASRPEGPAATAAQTALEPWLAAARTDLAGRIPPLALEGQVQARLAEEEALRAVRKARPRTNDSPTRAGWRWVAWLALPVAAACALLLATALVLQAPPAPASGNAPASAPFIALASMDTIAAEPNKVVVAAELPRAALTYYGLPFDPARADQPARAELLMSARGAVLAVRFVQ